MAQNKSTRALVQQALQYVTRIHDFEDGFILLAEA